MIAESTHEEVPLVLIDLAEFEQFRGNMLQKTIVGQEKRPESDKQREFLRTVQAKQTDSFLDIFEKKMTRDETSLIKVVLPNPEEKLTPKEVSEPPLSTEEQHYARLSNLSPKTAALPTFWATYQIELIKRQVIEPSYLAARTASSESGRTRIGKALDGRKWKPIDDCVRAVFRQLGGLRMARGAGSLYTDCKIAQAWWRGRIIRQAESDLGVDPIQAWNLLRLGSAPWLSIIEFATRRLTVISDHVVRSAIIKRLVEENLERLSSKERKKRVESLLRKVGQISTTQSLGFLSAEENLALINAIDF